MRAALVAGMHTVVKIIGLSVVALAAPLHAAPALKAKWIFYPAHTAGVPPLFEMKRGAQDLSLTRAESIKMTNAFKGISTPAGIDNQFIAIAKVGAKFQVARTGGDNSVTTMVFTKKEAQQLQQAAAHPPAPKPFRGTIKIVYPTK